MRCEGTRACKKKAAFKLSTDNGYVLVLCGLHLVLIVKKYRPVIRRGHTTVFIQKYREGV